MSNKYIILIFHAVLSGAKLLNSKNRLWFFGQRGLHFWLLDIFFPFELTTFSVTFSHPLETVYGIWVSFLLLLNREPLLVLDTVAHIVSLSPREMQAGGLWISVQPGLIE